MDINLMVLNVGNSRLSVGVFAARDRAVRRALAPSTPERALDSVDDLGGPVGHGASWRLTVPGGVGTCAAASQAW